MLSFQALPCLGKDQGITYTEATCAPNTPTQPKLARAKNDEGMALYRKDQPDEAAKLFEEAKNLDCHYLTAKLNLAATLAKSGKDFDKFYPALEEAYRLDSSKTLSKLHSDSDYDCVRPDLSINEIGEAYRTYATSLKNRTAHYKSQDLKFEFDYPANKVLMQHDGTCASGSKERADTPVALYLWDPDLSLDGEMGDGSPLTLSVASYRPSAYHRNPIIDYGSQEPMQGQAQKVSLAHGKAIQITYDQSGPECEIVKIERFELKNRDSLLLFEFRYGLNGNELGCCGGNREKCETGKKTANTQYQQEIEKIIRSVKFL